MSDASAIQYLVGAHYSRSKGFNGLPLKTILSAFSDHAIGIAALVECVNAGRISCVFPSTSINPHIKRLRDLPSERQVELLSSEPPDGVCVYPSAELVREHLDVEQFNDRPFTKKLVLAAAQLDWEGFDLGVLERYQNDPRYRFDFYDHSGMLSIRDASNDDATIPERDKVFLQTFGVGYAEDESRLAVVFLRYLTDLSPEHQQYWNSFRYCGKVKLHHEYYRSSYLGEFPEYGSYISAILTEMRLINELMNGIYGQNLFRETFNDETRPPGFTPFFRPTLKNFNDFILAMDKLLSENLNYDFFRGKVDLERDRVREDGKIVVERASSISLLEAWLRKAVEWEDEDEAIAIITGPLKRVRRKRQVPAHKLQENEYSREYDEQQHLVFGEVYQGLLNLRAMFARHPHAPSIDVPRFLADGKIAFA